MIRIFILGMIFLATSFTTVEEHRPLNKDYILSKVNTLRSKGCVCGNEFMPPANPLRWDKDLYKSAYSHAKDMNTYRYFSHYNREGKDIGERLDENGYGWQVAGENLGEGQKNFNEVLHDWLESESHCRMLMNPKVIDMAVARYGRYWVQHFGKRLPKGAKPHKDISKMR